MGRGKVIGIGFGIAIAALFILGMAASSISPKEAVEESLFVGPVSDLLPQRGDVGTEWLINSKSDDPFNYSYQYGGGFLTHVIKVDEKPILNATGYQASIVQKYSKSNGSGGTIAVWPVIHKFDSIQNAADYRQQVIQEVRTVGGYEEYGTSALSTTCYATLKRGQITDSLDFYCVKANVYYHIISSTDQIFMADGMKSVEEFVNIVARRM